MNPTDNELQRDPEDLTIRAPMGRVAGLRRRSVQLAVGGVAAAVAAALIVGLGIDFHSQVARDEARVLPPSGENAAGPAALADLPSTYADVRQPSTRPALPTATPDCPGCATVTEGTKAAAPVRAPSVTAGPSHGDDLTQAMSAIRQVGEQNDRLAAQLSAYESELTKERDQAWASGLFFKVGDSPTPVRAPSRDVAAAHASADDSPRLSEQASAREPADRKLAFLADAPTPGVELDHPYLRPTSPYQLQAGTVIAAALLTGINTDLPGDLIATVTAPVYDSRTGRYLLVPQGARLYGSYDSHVTPGQDRALIVWHRLLMPNGRSVELDHMRGTDAAGYAGVADAVDYHADKLALGAALSGVIAYAGNLARSGQEARTTAGDTIGDTVAQEASRTGAHIVDRQLDVQPTITIRPGWPVRVLVNRDVTLEPYMD